MKNEKIEYTKLGTSNIEVSKVALGTWAIGGWMWGGTEETESIKTIHAAFDKGINFIDTAPVYGFGQSEEIVGKAMQQYGSRDKIVLATKACLEWNEKGKVVRNATRERIVKEVEDSLKRLQTDYIDLYQIHWPDPLAPAEETAGTLNELLKQGKIRAIGVSNYSPEEMDDFRKFAPIHSVQPPYNLFERNIEKDVLPYSLKNNISVLSYSSICRGLLSGRMSSDTEFTGDDLRKYDPKFSGDRYLQYLKAVEELKRLAEAKGHSVLELAVRWVLDQGTIALWGARHPGQLDPIEQVFGWKLSQEDMKTIDELIQTIVTDPVGPEFLAPPNRKL